ncbi:MAG TPA: DoxX family protein [Bacteroidia bacterium]|nr:DoxX family protein [Bacteroidia bacterium]
MTESLTPKWSVQKKFIFLFILSYTFFYIFPFPFDAFTQLDFIFNYYQKANDAFVIWIGKNILHLQNFNKLIFSDSGDTTFDFVKFFIFLILSIISAIAILVIDRKRTNYEKLKSYLFIYIRYCIGFYMLVYGFDKIFKSHFPFPSLGKLEQTFGESSPQGLLWAFMGYSTSYTIFLGIIEVLSGFLLLFRRTTALGALLVLLIMINVAVINFSYDVPVKLFALHMVAYAILLLYPFFNSIFQFFILKRETKLTEHKEIVFPKFIQSYRKIIKVVVIVSFTLLFMNFSWENMKVHGDSAPKPALYGIYKNVGPDLKRNQNAKSTYFSLGIEEIIFDKKNTLVKFGRKNFYFDTKTDTVKNTILFTSNSDTTKKIELKYALDNNILTLSENDSTKVSFEKIDVNSFPLLNRGFRWVVEYPENN